MNNIKLITFDLDDTLWDIGPVIIKAELTTRKYIEEKVGAIDWGDMESFLNLRKDLVKEDPSLEWDIGKLRKEIFRIKLAPLASNQAELAMLTEDSYEYFLDKRHDIIFYDGAITALEELANLCDLGVLTNGNADIKKLGIDQYFKFSISSLDVKSNKPELGHFEQALRLSNLDPNEVLHIGDHQVADMIGATDAGFSALWFNNKQSNWEQDISKPNEILDWHNYQTIKEVL